MQLDADDEENEEEDEEREHDAELAPGVRERVAVHRLEVDRAGDRRLAGLSTSDGTDDVRARQTGVAAAGRNELRAGERLGPEIVAEERLERIADRMYP